MPALAHVCRKTQHPNPCQLLTFWHYSHIRVHWHEVSQIHNSTTTLKHTCSEHDNDDDPSQFRLKKFSLNRSRYSQMNVSKRKEWWGTCKREANILTRYRLTVLCEKEDYVSSESISVERILVGDDSIHFRQHWDHKKVMISCHSLHIFHAGSLAWRGAQDHHHHDRRPWSPPSRDQRGLGRQISQPGRISELSGVFRSGRTSLSRMFLFWYRTRRSGQLFPPLSVADVCATIVVKNPSHGIAHSLSQTAEGGANRWLFSRSVSRRLLFSRGLYGRARTYGLWIDGS